MAAAPVRKCCGETGARRRAISDRVQVRREHAAPRADAQILRRSSRIVITIQQPQKNKGEALSQGVGRKVRQVAVQVG